MGKPGQIRVIQALRGIAAAMVMIYHKREVLNTTSVPFGEFFFGAAAMGVDLFFIISGFIMVMVNERTKSSIAPSKTAWHFFVNRIIRILPLYYFTIILFYAVVWNGFGFLHDKNGIVNIIKSFAFIPILPQAAAPFYGYAAIIVGWTLNYEMFFYGLLAFCLLFGKYKYAIFASIILTLLVLVPLVFRGYVAFDAENHYHFWHGYGVLSYANLMTNPIIWEFVLGMLLGGWYVFKKPKCPKSVYAVLLSIFLLWTGIDLFAKWNPGHGVTHWALPIFGLVATLVFYESQYGMNVPKWLMFLGKISFSVYLLHPVVQYSTQYFFNHHGLGRWSGTPVFLLASSVLTIAAATITQYLIENHFSNLLKKWMVHG